MGKPYDTELQQLPSTYEWSLGMDVTPLARAIRRATALPLMAVGSGGSFTAAEFAATLHRQLAAGPASAHTPLDAVATGTNLQRAVVLMATAGGSNPDVLGSFKLLASREPAQLIVLCLRRGTALARRAARFPFVDFIELDLPTGHDGFLATNSLLASVVLLLRAYAQATVQPLAHSQRDGMTSCRHLRPPNWMHSSGLRRAAYVDCAPRPGDATRRGRPRVAVYGSSLG